MFKGLRNTDTSAASRARMRAVSAICGGYRRVYPSLKDCSVATGIPSSRICESAKSGKVSKGGYLFKYI